MRPDENLLREETREQIKRALIHHARHEDPDEVLLYAALRARPWHDVIAAAGVSSQRLAQARDSVEQTLHQRLTDYHDA
jgi:crotonobetainyl-CoA:carnitine CoA-transferase CaiB-like acyl-CoA transferase